MSPLQPLALILCLASTAAPAAPRDEPDATPAAPTTRAGHWRQLREAKLERLEPYEPGFLERRILAFEKAERPSIFEINLWGLYPRIQGIANGSQAAVGVRLWRPNLGGSPLDLHGSAFYSLNDYEFYDLQLGVIPGADVRLEAVSALPLRSTRGDDVFELATIAHPERPGWGLYASARYQHYTQLPFFGLGRASRRADETTFLHRDLLYEVHAIRQVGRGFLVGASGGYLETGVGPGEDTEFPSIGEVFVEEDVPGLEEQPDYWTASAVLHVDRRDVVANPGRGAVLSLEAQRFRDPDERYSFTRLAVDGRAFLPLGSPQRVLALRGYGVRDRADAGQHVPFFVQSTLGGSHTLRGYRNFRFRGEQLALFQAEYRWEANPAVELALFVDSGVVSGSGQSLGLGELETSWGAGLRFKTPGAFLMRFEWARGTEDHRFYFRLSPAW